jgi:tetratricopeptide (TPR) repeat protein
METTPLQLYKKAYDLHYRENNPEKARELYRKLIRDHADSDASFYASIQLSKIQSQAAALTHIDATHDETSAPRASSGWLVIFLLIVNLLLTAVVIIGFALHVRSVTARNESISRMMACVGKLSVGRDETALEILNELKIALREDITPYAISADIYCKQHDYLKARKEYEAFDRLFPGNVLVRQGVKEVNKLEDRYIKKTKRIQAIQDSIKQATLIKEIKKEPETEPEPRRILRTDDIIYF